MNKLLLIILFVAVSLSACKKDNKPVKGGNTKNEYNISFNMSGFSQQHEGLKTNDVDTVMFPSEYYRYIRTLYMGLYDSQGNVVKTAKKREYEAGYGTFTQTLPEGNYTAVFIGALNDDIRGLPSNEIKYTTQGEFNDEIEYGFFSYQGYSNFINPFRETFYKKIDFNVSPSGNMTHAVELERVVAQIVVNIEDAIPNNVSYLNISIDSANEYLVYRGDYTNGENEANNIYSTPASMHGKKNIKFAFHALVDPNSSHTVEITSYNNNNNTQTATKISYKRVENVLCSPNKITLLSGNLFGGTQSANSTPPLKVDTTWNATVINKSF